MPDDIKTHAKALLKPYVRKPEAPAIIASAQKLARLALENEDLYPAHRRKILHNAIWYLTEADGKWTTRYKSKKVLELAESDSMSPVRINHEHVFTRKNLVEDMIKDSESLLTDLPRLHSLLDTAVGCIVTEDEHARLSDGVGWERYAGEIDVYDTSKSPRLLLEMPVKDVSDSMDEI